jgi:hypothetical protein
MGQEGERHSPRPGIPALPLSRSRTRDFRPGTFFLAAAWIFPPAIVFAQGGGGLTIQVFGVVQVEPGPNVLTLAVRNEEVRFAVRNMRCTGQQCSKDRFVSDIKHRTPSLYIRGPEPMLDLLVKEKPSQRVLRLEGLYYLDSRMLVLHDLTPFNGQPKSSGPPQ